VLEVKDKILCCGCTACVNVCPERCLSMQADDEGFLYPVVDSNGCINCGACEQVCPLSKKEENITGNYPRAVVLRTKDTETLFHSTSGGFFTPLANWIFEHNGVVVGAGFTDDFEVVHTFIDKDSRERVQALRGSKYVQSNLIDCFPTVKQYLEQGKLTCFSGTPCQVSGLKSFLKKEYNNLITVDVVCHGTPSPKLWNRYLEYMKNKYKSAIKELNFRKKTYGYHCGTMEVVFEAGRIYHGSARTDLMLKSFFSELASRPSC